MRRGAPGHRTGRRPDQRAGPTSSVSRSSATTTSPSKWARASAIHSAFGPGLGRGDQVGQDEGAHAVARRRPCRVLDRRVVVEDVHEPLQPDRLDQVRPHHGVDEHVRPRAELVQPRARDGVAGDDDRPATLLDPEADRGADRGVIGGGGGDPHLPVVQHGAPLAFDDLRRGPPLQVGVMLQAVADVELQHGLGGLQERRRAHGPVHSQRVRLEGRDPARRDDVVEVRGVIAVQMGQEEPAQGPGSRTGRSGAHEDAAPAVEQQITRPAAHQRRRAGAPGVGQRAPAPQDDQLHAIVS